MKETVVLGLLVAVVALSVINTAIITSRTQAAATAATDMQEKNRPAELSITVITAACTDCAGVGKVLEELKGKARIIQETTVDAASEQGKELIRTRGIARVPTLIVSGEVEKQTTLWQGWKAVGGERIFTDVRLPYVDALTGEVEGRVAVTTLADPGCTTCGNMSGMVDFLKQSGVVFGQQKIVNYTAAADLIAQFGVTKVPAIIISKNVVEYPEVAAVWAQLKAVEKDGFYVVGALGPPYRELASGQVVGLAAAVYLNDSSCGECYDVRINRQILAQFGINPVNETALDTGSAGGKELIKKYNLTAAPVLLVSPEAAAYELFDRVWPQVGTVEADGWYVMREPEVLGTYRNLTTGAVVKPAPPAPQPTGMEDMH